MPRSAVSRGIVNRCRPGWPVAAAVAVRLLAAAALVFGPWTDEPSELDGWDVDRFQQIADAPGTPYIDHEVEYPPLTVAVAELILADDVVSSHRRLVVLSLAIDLGVAAVLARWWRSGVAGSYLLLGLPLVPSGLLRLDLWAVLAAVIAMAAIAPGRERPPAVDQPGSAAGTGKTIISGTMVATGTVFAVATVTGAMIKLWPALLVAVAVGARRTRIALSTAVLGLAAVGVWLTISGSGAISQVTSLRGATGWHVESIPGALASLIGDQEPRLEADAFRIGTLDDTVVLLGRAIAVGVTLAAATLARRSGSRPTERAALVMLGATSALIVTAPLVSPQFLLWLTPWAAILHRDRVLLTLTASAAVLTAAILGVFGPPDLDHWIAATGLLLRNGLLVAVVGVSLHRLRGADGSGSGLSQHV